MCDMCRCVCLCVSMYVYVRLCRSGRSGAPGLPCYFGRTGSTSAASSFFQLMFFFFAATVSHHAHCDPQHTQAHANPQTRTYTQTYIHSPTLAETSRSRVQSLQQELKGYRHCPVNLPFALSLTHFFLNAHMLIYTGTYTRAHADRITSPPQPLLVPRRLGT
jgi:hypothetical protein